VSPLEEHAKFLLKLIAEQPDLTLNEVVGAMKKARIAGSRTAVWRFFARHGLSLKKKDFVRDRAKARRGGPRPPPLDARARLLRPGETGVCR
jgi:transposase